MPMRWVDPFATGRPGPESKVVKKAGDGKAEGLGGREVSREGRREEAPPDPAEVGSGGIITERLLENVLVGPEGGDVAMDFQGDLEIDHIVLGDGEFPIRPALEEGDLVLDGFVTRNVLHIPPTP
jgi:hypothetical protein